VLRKRRLALLNNIMYKCSCIDGLPLLFSPLYVCCEGVDVTSIERHIQADKALRPIADSPGTKFVLTFTLHSLLDL